MLHSAPIFLNLTLFLFIFSHVIFLYILHKFLGEFSTHSPITLFSHIVLYYLLYFSDFAIAFCVSLCYTQSTNNCSFVRTLVF